MGLLDSVVGALGGSQGGEGGGMGKAALIQMVLLKREFIKRPETSS